MVDLKIQLILDGDEQASFLLSCPNIETIPNPEWIDPKDGSEVPMVKRYTDREWIVEKYKRIGDRWVNSSRYEIAKTAISHIKSNIKVSEIKV